MDQVIYGMNPVIEVLRATGAHVREILIARGRKGNLEEILKLAEKKQIRIRYRKRSDLADVAKGGLHQGIVAVVEGNRYATLEEIIHRWKQSRRRALILVLDSIQDPQNLGALIRTANFCGSHGVIIPKNRAAQITSTVVKASTGATAFTPVARVTNIASTLETLRKKGIWIVGTTGEAETSLFHQDLTDDLAVVIGSENRGIRPLVLRKCDVTVSIPLRGEISSLNASVAAGIVLAEVVRQRLTTGNFKSQKLNDP